MKDQANISLKGLAFLLIVSFLVILCRLVIQVNKESYFRTFRKIEIPPRHSDVQTAEAFPARESITFILGEDHDPANPYYNEALKYYRFNEEDRTEYVIDSCRSLLSVKNYLENNPSGSGQPWGLINLVVHSNEWSDMGVPVVPNGKRASIKSIEEAINNGSFVHLPPGIIDRRTDMIIHGCGLGKNKPLLRKVSTAFGGDEPPAVSSSLYFIFYESDDYNGRPENFRRYQANYWYAFYPTNQKPAEIKLADQLAQRYSNYHIDWEDALSRAAPRWPGDEYVREFRVPVVWTVTYPSKDSRPDLGKREDQLAWVAAETELQEALRDTRIPLEYFNWTVRKIKIYSEDGYSVEYAVQAIADCTILCVLQALTD
ncbi:MAG: hypothetical protein IIA45_05410 [Bacteroidetes bacterium]|nr:hypothetical protein [Bacteroidota bacterium]